MPCVLIVDDSTSRRERLSRVATSAGYRALETASGRDALGLVASAEPGVVLVGGCVAGMEIDALVREIRNLPPAVRTREHVDPLAGSRITLREHYARKSARLGRARLRGEFLR